MGTYSSDLLPNSTGLNLGSPSQRWDVFAKDLTADEINSTSANPATTGTINLASTDTIAWRNAANNADVLLQKSQGAGALPADTLEWPNGVSAAEFITGTANPSTTGVVRLATGDAVKFRNNGNSGDLSGLAHNADDTMQVGDAAGIKSAAITSSGTVTSSGTFATPSGTGVTVQPAGSGGNAASLLASGGATGGAVNVTGGAGSAGNGGSVTITGGSSAVAAVGGAVVLVPGSGVSGQANCVLNGSTVISNKITSYNGTATGGTGIPVISTAIVVPSQNAAIGTTVLLNLPATGLYRLNYSLAIGTAGNAVNLTGTFGWTNITAHTLTTANIACNTLDANSTSALGLGSIVFAATAASDVTYATALSGAIGLGFYTIRLMLEFLG